MEASLSRVLEFRIPADTRYIGVVRHGIRSLAESAGFTREDVSDVEVAVSEAVTNSVKHGSPDQDVAAVVVKCHALQDCLVVEVEDESEAASIPPCPELCDTREESGRGVLMMHSLMDEFENCRTEHGMRIRMAKQRH